MLHRDYSELSGKEWEKIDPPMLPPRNVEVQERLMVEAHRLMDSVCLTHWLANGELVTIYRDGKLLDHNQDIDFICYTEDIQSVAKRLRDRFLEAGYATRLFKNNSRLSAYKDDEMVSIEGYYLKGKLRCMKNDRIPSRYFETETYLEFNGVTYRVPMVEKFLSWKYKNWKKEYKGDTKLKDKYLNKKKLRGK